MPGHVKLGKAGEPDPDPLPYLVVTLEMKRADMLRPYDSKKSYWCPDTKGGFVECMLENDDGTKANVMVGHEVRKFRNWKTINRAIIQVKLLYKLKCYFIFYRKRYLSRMKSGKSILQNSRNVRIWRI